MTPEEHASEFYSRAPRYRTKMLLEDEFRIAIHEAYEDIAMALENGTLTGGKHPVIAAAIRARISEGK
jgi:hypothetical protein